MEQFHGTTILSSRRDGVVAMGGDGQVSMGNTVMKGNARKGRRLYRDQVLAGFAGGTADAFTLFELFEAQLEKTQGQLTRAAVELAKLWRSERSLRRLEVNEFHLNHTIGSKQSREIRHVFSFSVGFHDAISIMYLNKALN